MRGFPPLFTEDASRKKEMDTRKNETAHLCFRSERIFKRSGHWYFRTREGINVGPYATEFEAEVESSILKNLLKRCKDGESQEVIREFLFDSITLSAGTREEASTLNCL